MLLSSTAGSSLRSNESAIAGHSNGTTTKAYATFILSLPEIALQLQVPVGPLSSVVPRPSAQILYCKRRTRRSWERGYPSLRQPSKNQRTFVSFERMSAFVQLFEWRPRMQLSP